VPGAAEIRAVLEAAGPLAADAGLELVPLHGELPIEEQARG
jgi:HrpA-like RNA helicase